jgi:hypothetical protein
MMLSNWSVKADAWWRVPLRSWPPVAGYLQR